MNKTVEIILFIIDLQFDYVRSKYKYVYAINTNKIAFILPRFVFIFSAVVRYG